MNILHVVQGYSPAVGGTEIQIQRVSEELVRQFGDRVTVFTSDCFNAGGFVNPRARRMPAKSEEINGVQVKRFKVFNLAGPVLKPFQWLAFKVGLPFNEYLRVWYSGPHLAGLADAVKEWESEVIAAASFPLLHMFTALNAAKKSRRPVVLVGSQHPEDRWGYDRRMIDRAIRRADAYIAMTGYEANYVTQRGGDPDRITIIGNGVNPDDFECCDRNESRAHLRLPVDAPVIGFIGQLGRHKGVDTLLQAMPEIWKELPEARLLVAGARTSFQPKIQAIVDGMTANQRDKIVWRMDFPEAEKAGLVAAIDVLAYPSGFESFGIAFLEAWAAGKPVIGCRRGAVPWVVEADVDGLLIEWQNPEALAKAAITLLGNPSEANRMGENGRKKVLARYTWPVIARRFREVYAQAVSAGSKYT